MKKYLVEFTFMNGEVEQVEFTTDRLERSINEWCRNRHVVNHKIISEGTSNSKQMLFG